MKRELLNTKLVREILALISSGEYEAGKRLPSERKLCDMFDISRGTVRQALSDLENLDMVKIKRGSGVYVKSFSVNKIPKEVLPANFDQVSVKDILAAREVIESACIRLACERSDESLIAELEGLIDRMVENIDNLPEFIKYDMDFHAEIVKASGNAALVTAFNAISEYHKYSQVLTSLHEDEEEIALDYHRRMLYALQKREPDLGERAVRLHLKHMQQSIVEK